MDLSGIYPVTIGGGISLDGTTVDGGRGASAEPVFRGFITAIEGRTVDPNDP